MPQESWGSCLERALGMPILLTCPKDPTVILFLVPPGPFVAHVPDGDGTRALDLSLPAYYVAERIVTNRQFALFLNEAQPTDAQLRDWVGLGGSGSYYQECRIEREGGVFAPRAGCEHLSATHVTWHGADAYCRWAGLRMLTELEWEKAMVLATGLVSKPLMSDGADDPTTARASGAQLPVQRGPILEWCADWFDPEAYARYEHGDLSPSQEAVARVVRGPWTDPSERSASFHSRGYSHPSRRYGNVGFRCALDAPKPRPATGPDEALPAIHVPPLPGKEGTGEAGRSLAT